MSAEALIRIVKDSGASEFQRSKASVRLGELGAKEAVPALAALLSDERLSTYARYGLEPIADPSAAEALRSAATKLKGNLQIGAINSIGHRREEASIPMLSKMLSDGALKFMQGQEMPLATAIIAAIGNIGGPTASIVLQSAMSKAPVVAKPAIADAMLVCAERLLTSGKRDPAMALYASLSSPGVPKPARLAAMSGIIREETSIGRPR